MIVTYDIKTIFNVLWNKKISILIVGLIFGLIAIPISNLSYEESLEDYKSIKSSNNKVNKVNKGINEAVVLVEKDRKKITTEITDISKVIQSPVIVSKIMEELGGENTDDSKIIKGLSFVPLESLNTIIIRSNYGNRDKFIVIIEQLIKNNNLSLKNMFPNEEIYLKTVKYNYTDVDIKEKSNEFLFKLPTKEQNKFKIITTATLFGVVIGCTLVLIKDFWEKQFTARD